jgi:diguanylate cyclase (GGDEF)-like protein/putative nucleotidyltransferase with HDIG domain
LLHTDMNIYALFPLVAIFAYIPLLITTISSRPWQRQHTLFTLFLVAAMIWSTTDYLFRSNLFPQHSLLMLRLVMIAFTWTAVQFHCFSSSFFSPGERRWLPLALASIPAVIILAAVGYMPEGVIASGNKLYPQYGEWVAFLAALLLGLVILNMYALQKRMQSIDSPVLHNQIVSVMLGLSVLTAFSLAGFLPWGREFPISHFGSIINALILSYATVRYQLLDIRFVLRQGLAWISLGIIGIATYWFLLVALQTILHFKLDFTAALIATMLAFVFALLIHRLRDFLFVTMGRAFRGPSYDSRQKLSRFANGTHNFTSFKEQGGELLRLVVKAIGCNKTCLLFLESGSEDFSTQIVEPEDEDGHFASLRLAGHNPIADYLRREHKPLTRQNLATLPEFRSLQESQSNEPYLNELELLVPLISRDRLVGMLALDKKQSGIYLLEDLNLLQEVASRVAESMEQEYLRERLKQREKELSVINRSSSIITSSLDIQRTYDSFISELKKAVDVSWAAITLVEENEVYFLTLSSEIGSPWQVGERIPLKGTANEWLADNKKAIIEPDLSAENRFVTGKYLQQQGVCSIAYLPLIVDDDVIGSLIVASQYPNGYSQSHLDLLEQLAGQIGAPIEHSRRYAEAQRMARIDELTSLLNRRSLDEILNGEVGRHSRYGGVLSLIILDLDSMKNVNDCYGHLAGDKLLKQIGSILKITIRSADQAFRYGGDEFAVLLPQTSIDDALHVAERIRLQVSSETKGDIPTTASLGLASWPTDGITSDEIVTAADAALYQAKRSGGNRSQRYQTTSLMSNYTEVNAPINQDSEALSTIYFMAAAVDARDRYTGDHSRKVNKYALAMAKALNLDPLETNRISACALLHDIGKVGISDEILIKPDKLNEDEWKAIKSHPQVGATIASHVRQLGPYIPGILYHHERYDGKGYPEGIKGDEIPLEARILAVADAFAAMTSDRSHSNAISYEEAIEEIKKGSCTQFDPNLVDVFLSIVDEILSTQERTAGATPAQIDSTPVATGGSK